MSATLLVTSREFVDVDNVFSKHPLTNNVAVKRGVNAIKQSVTNLMLLKSGEKPFHPEIKSPVYDLLFENSSAVEQIVLEQEVIKYITFYEPRFEVTSVKVTFTNPNEVQCSIIGNIKNVSAPVTVNIMVNRLR